MFCVKFVKCVPSLQHLGILQQMHQSLSNVLPYHQERRLQQPFFLQYRPKVCGNVCLIESEMRSFQDQQLTL